MSRAPWIDEVAARGVAEMAGALGLQQIRGQTWACPACAAPKRHPGRGDRRGAIGLARGGKGWRCHACGEGGDGLDLAAWVACGSRLRDLDVGQRRQLRQRLAGMGLCSGRVSWQQAPIQAQLPVQPIEAGPEGPPPDEVQALLDRARPLDGLARAYCETRGWGRFMPGLEREGLILGTATTGPWPGWWSGGRARTWRLWAPMWGADGGLLGIHARAVVPVKDGMPKAIGHRMRGRAWLANRAALEGLQGRGLSQVAFCEGIADFWALAGWAAEARPEMQVLGGVSGSFPGVMELPWTQDAKVWIAVHADEAGDRYARQIVEGLRGTGARAARARMGGSDGRS